MPRTAKPAGEKLLLKHYYLTAEQAELIQELAVKHGKTPSHILRRIVQMWQEGREKKGPVS